MSVWRTPRAPVGMCDSCRHEATGKHFLHFGPHQFVTLCNDCLTQAGRVITAHTEPFNPAPIKASDAQVEPDLPNEEPPSGGIVGGKTMVKPPRAAAELPQPFNCPHGTMMGEDCITCGPVKPFEYATAEEGEAFSDGYYTAKQEARAPQPAPALQRIGRKEWRPPWVESQQHTHSRPQPALAYEPATREGYRERIRCGHCDTVWNANSGAEPCPVCAPQPEPASDLAQRVRARVEIIRGPNSLVPQWKSLDAVLRILDEEEKR